MRDSGSLIGVLWAGRRGLRRLAPRLLARVALRLAAFDLLVVLGLRIALPGTRLDLGLDFANLRQPILATLQFLGQRQIVAGPAPLRRAASAL